jgi:hypothetical protein
VKPAQLVNSYLSDPNFVESTTKYSGDAAAQLRTILAYLATDRPITFEQCIAWARHQFEKSYANSIKQLLYSLPKDHVSCRSCHCVPHIDRNFRSQSRANLSGRDPRGHQSPWRLIPIM